MNRLLHVSKKIFMYNLIPALSILIFSCTFYNEEDLFPDYAECDTLNVTYSGTVVPVLVNNCYSCHSSDNYEDNSAPLLEGYQNLEPYASNGILSGVINHKPGFQQMPRNRAKLSDCDIAKIDKWILDGANNN